MIRSKVGQRLVGLFVLILGCGFTYWEWDTALSKGEYHPKYAVLFPCLAVIGLMLLLFPMDMDKFQAEYGLDRPQTLRHFPAIWKVMTFVAIAAGLLNWYLIAHSWD